MARDSGGVVLFFHLVKTGEKHRSNQMEMGIQEGWHLPKPGSNFTDRISLNFKGKKYILYFVYNSLTNLSELN